MPDRSDDLLLMDILESREVIEEYMGNASYDDFVRDRKTIDTVVRNFEIIGEASKMISKQMKSDNPLIE